MAVAYQSHQSATASSGTTLTITKPTSLSVGDLMVAVCHVGSTTAWSTPSGWTALGSAIVATNFPTRTNLFAKVADASDVAASNFSFTGGTSGDPKVGVLYRITGDFSGTITDYFSQDTDSSVSPSGSTLTFTGGVTPKAANSLLIWVAGCGGTGLDADPSYSSQAIANNNPTWTEDYDSGIQVGDWIRLGTAHASYAPATATGNYSATVGTPEQSLVHAGSLLSINETINVTANVDPLIVTSTIPNATITGDSNVTVTPLTITSTIPDTTVSIEAGKVTNMDKSTASSVTNLDKS